MISTRHCLDDARIVHKEALSLKNGGHEVILLFQCNQKFEFYSYDGKVLTQGKNNYGETEYMGLKVFGAPKRQGFLGKIATYFEMSRLAVKIGADAYHVHEPDLCLAIGARAKSKLKKLGHKNLLIHDMHEFPPGLAVDRTPTIFKKIMYSLLVSWDKWLNKKVDHIFTANSIVRGYSLFLDHKKDADILYNSPSTKIFKQNPAPIYDPDKGPLVLCHEGSLTFDRGLKEMIEAISSLKNKVHLLIIGDIFGEEKKWYDNRVNELSLSNNITITGWLPYKSIGEHLKKAHLGLILFRNCMTNRMAGPPNKLFNYMNYGLPVLGVDFPEIRRIILEENCGKVIEDQSVESIINCIKEFLNNPTRISEFGKNGQLSVNTRYSWEKNEQVLLNRYNQFQSHLGLPKQL